MLHVTVRHTNKDTHTKVIIATQTFEILWAVKVDVSRKLD